MNLLRVSLLGILLLIPGMLRADSSKALEMAGKGSFRSPDDPYFSAVSQEMISVLKASPAARRQIERSPGRSTFYDSLIWAAARRVDFNQKAFFQKYPHLAEHAGVFLVRKSLKGRSRVFLRSMVSGWNGVEKVEMLYGNGPVPHSVEEVRSDQPWIGPLGTIDFGQRGTYRLVNTARGPCLKYTWVAREMSHEPIWHVIAWLKIEDTALVPDLREGYDVPKGEKLGRKYLSARSMPDTPKNRNTMALEMAAYWIRARKWDPSSLQGPLWKEVKSLIEADRDLRKNLSEPMGYEERQSRVDHALLWAAARASNFDQGTFHRRFPHLEEYGKVISMDRDKGRRVTLKATNSMVGMLYGDSSVPEYRESREESDLDVAEPPHPVDQEVAVIPNSQVQQSLTSVSAWIFRIQPRPEQLALVKEVSDLIRAGTVVPEASGILYLDVGAMDSLLWAAATKSEFDQEKLKAQFPFLMSYGKVIHLSKALFGEPRLIYQPPGPFTKPRMLYGDSVQPQIAELVVPERWEGTKNLHEKFGYLSFEATSEGPYLRRLFVSVPDRGGARSHDVGWIRVEASRLVPERLEVYRVPEGDFRKPENRIGTAVAILPGAEKTSK